jgi:hypothetical protein
LCTCSSKDTGQKPKYNCAGQTCGWPQTGSNAKGEGQRQRYDRCSQTTEDIATEITCEIIFVKRSDFNARLLFSWIAGPNNTSYLVLFNTNEFSWNAALHAVHL